MTESGREKQRRRKDRRRNGRMTAGERARKRRYDLKRSRTPEGRAKQRERKLRWRAAHPEAAKAHDAVRYAMRVGKLVPGPCAVCGAEKTYGHHEDYSKLLEVEWLCARHHRLRHMQAE